MCFNEFFDIPLTSNINEVKLAVKAVRVFIKHVRNLRIYDKFRLVHVFFFKSMMTLLHQECTSDNRF